MAEAVVQIKNLKVQYVTQDGVVTALDDFSLDLAPGEVVGLVGESGSGKSTVGLSLIRLIPPPGRIAEGHINLDGRDLLTLSERDMRAVRGSLVGMIFQDALAALDPTMKVGKQLMEALQVHHGLGAAAARRRAIELLAMVGIPAPERRINNYPHQFSGGMRQRVMIAMAISCRPKLLIADEATTALDVTIQRQILDLIATLRDEIGAAVIFITHDVAVVAQ